MYSGLLLFLLNGTEGTIQFLNDSHFMTNNCTALKLTPEEMKRAEQISSNILETLRKSGVDLPPLNDSKLINLKESEINHAEQLIEKYKELSNLNDTN